MPMYTEGPSSAELLKNEYREHTSRIKPLRVFDHFHGQTGKRQSERQHGVGRAWEFEVVVPAGGRSGLLLAPDTAPARTQYHLPLDANGKIRAATSPVSLSDQPLALKSTVPGMSPSLAWLWASQRESQPLGTRGGGGGSLSALEGRSSYLCTSCLPRAS